MVQGALRLHFVVLGTTTLISLASASAAIAQANTQRPLPPEKGQVTAQAGATTKLHGTAMKAGRQQTAHAAAHQTTRSVRDASVRTVRRTTVRTTGGTTVAGGGHWVWRGGRSVWQSYGFTGGGYAPVITATAYGGTYGGAGHSCWWYRHYDPAGLPRWCPRYYGSSYGYSYRYSEPSIRYSYGYSAPAGYRYGTTRTTSTRVTTTRVANVSSTRSTNHAHGMAVAQGGGHPAETGAHVHNHARAGAQVRAPSAAGTNVRTQTSP
jgi:hypothetical protein